MGSVRAAAHGRAPVALLAAVAIAIGGCARCDRGAAPARPASASSHRYLVRGEVVQLPARPGAELMVRHEAIDDFVNASGQVVGMDAMVMGFAVEPRLLPPGLSIGDKVALRVAMDWQRPALVVEAIERLPPGTPLRFDRARAAERGAPGDAGR